MQNENLKLKTFASFETSSASRYLATLCAHFGRKVETQCDDQTGWIKLPFGRCDIKADDNQLELQASADDDKKLELVMQVVTSHLERFAFRENPTLVWQSQSTAP